MISNASSKLNLDSDSMHANWL